MIWLVLVPLIPIVVFWFWMFKHMRRNQYLPRCPFSVTNKPDPRIDWTIAFIALNIVAAIYYYKFEYR